MHKFVPRAIVPRGCQTMPSVASSTAGSPRGRWYAMLRMAAGVRPSRHAAIAGGLNNPGAMVGWRSGLDENGAVGADGPDAELAALRSRIDLTSLPPLTRAVTEQVIGSTAEPSYAKNLVCSEPWLEAAVAALAAGAPVVADGPMVVAGIASEVTICKTGESLTERLSRTAGIAKAAAAVRLAFGEAGPGAIWVVGEEPVAIYEILARDVQPTLVIGMPAGFVAAVQAKQALRDSGVPAVTNAGELGGPVAAAAVCGVLLAAAWRAGRQADAGPGHTASATRRPGAIAGTAGRARRP